jgi:hypothetical protein
MMIESMLMQRMEKSTMDTRVPIWAMEVFALDLCASRTSMLIFVVSDHVLHKPLLDHAHIPLRKKCRWVNGIHFVIEGGNSVSGKVST